MEEAKPIPKQDLPKPHPSYPIIARAMRELALWWPKPVDASEAPSIVVDLSQSDVWENRMALDADNYSIADRSFEWLKHESLIELSDHGVSQDATLTQKGLDLLHSMPAFRRFQQTTDQPDREALIPILDRELSQLLGPAFLSWLQTNRSEG
jgi:predicted transcriptional regulator